MAKGMKSRKYRSMFLAAVLSAGLVLCLTACSGSSPDGSGGTEPDGGGTTDPPKSEEVLEVPEDASEYTDVDFGDSQVHEELVPLEFDDGESVDSVYYKRTTDPKDGSAAYLVKRASDGDDDEGVYLPMSKTVCYVDETLGDRAYYERVPLSYKVDGQEVETYQYQIVTSSFGISKAVEPATEAPAQAGQGGAAAGQADAAGSGTAGNP